MPRLALFLVAVWFVSLFVFRTALQWWRTGSGGVRGFSGPVGSLEWNAGLLASLGLAAGLLAPLAALLGWPGGGLWYALDAVHLTGAALVAAGIAGALAAQLDMGDSWRIGVGHDERTALVTGGVFAYVRNPIFSFIAVSGAGLVALVPNAWSAAAFALALAGIELQVRFVEEPHLARTHGAAYREYAARVGRFAPGLGRGVHGAPQTRDWTRIALWLVVATMAYNLLEAGIALASGVAAQSVVLVGFGLDSVIECAAAGVLLWRLRLEWRGVDAHALEAAERRVHRFVGVTFFLLAAYVVAQALWLLVAARAPEESWLGIALAVASLVVMPLVAWGKLRAAREIGSAALRAEAKETLACSYLSFALLLGLGANALWGWWQADPLAALAMVPWLVREGLEGVRGEACVTEAPGCTPER